MDNNESNNLSESLKNISPATPEQQHKTHEGEKDADKEGTIIKEEKKSGMDMGTTLKEDKEQDLDNLIHSQGTLRSSSQFPGPDNV